MTNFKEIMDKLISLPACAIITTGRTGTDFLQSLLDSHSEVMTFNGILFFHDFWDASKCVTAGKFDLPDLLDEFIGVHIEKFKSRYDIQERKDQLGDNCNLSLNIDLKIFKTTTVSLMEGREINSKNVLISIYAAYSACLGHNLEKKTLLFHHIHHFAKLERYLEDFRDSKIICMTRDPRANFVSGIENWREYDKKTDNGRHLLFCINRILEDANPLKRYKNEYRVIKLETLGMEETIRNLCKWLNISYDKCLRESTWGGLRWHGDRLSKRKSNSNGFSKEMLDNKWKSRLNAVDKYILNFIMNNRLVFYGYESKKINFFDLFIVPLLILLPMKYELRYLSARYIYACFKTGNSRYILINFYCYLKRVSIYFKFYLKFAIKNEAFYQPVLG